MRKQYLKGLVEKIEEDGVISVAVATDLSEDRDGEIVNPDGVDLDNFMRNPVLLWAHDYRNPPIGKVTQIVKENNRILFRPQFAVDINPQARQIFDLMKAGYLNAFSIGFMPKERVDNIYTKSELLEISVVPVPANANALVLARSAGGFDNDLLDQIEKGAKQLEDDLEKDQQISKLQEDFAALAKSFDDLQKSVAGSKPSDGTEGQPTERSNTNSLVSQMKKILQTVNRATADGLRDLRNLKKQ